jgi:hypothetical protein
MCTFVYYFSFNNLQKSLENYIFAVSNDHQERITNNIIL